jgi:hypothetical protein
MFSLSSDSANYMSKRLKAVTSACSLTDLAEMRLALSSGHIHAYLRLDDIEIAEQQRALDSVSHFVNVSWPVKGCENAFCLGGASEIHADLVKFPQEVRPACLNILASTSSLGN